MTGLPSLPSFLIKRLSLEENELLVQDHPGSRQKVATHTCPIGSPQCSALTPEVRHPPLCARDVWGQPTHLTAVHVAVLGMKQVRGVHHRGELDTVWSFAVFGL